ncbi:MAG: hypothetical protein AB7G87_01265 [Clostridia bacterium]
MVKPRTLQQSQQISDISRDTGHPIRTVREILESYERNTKDECLNGKKVPLPGGMGYLYLTLTTSKSREVELELTDSIANITPKLKTVATFSSPWKEFINSDQRAASLIDRLLKSNEESKKDKLNKK